MEKIDAVIIGSGVIGLAVAREISNHYASVILIDKNRSFGEETSSRNSEVIHAGIYYPASSLKAKLCVEGKEALYKYCEKNLVPFKRVGKLIVANGEVETMRLEQLKLKAEANGVMDLAWKSQHQLSQIEPYLKASDALLSPSTGIIDVHSYMQSLLKDFEDNGGIFVRQTQFLSSEYDGDYHIVNLNSVGERVSLKSKMLVNAAGLHSIDVANNIQGLNNELLPELHFCCGHYFSYSGNSPFQHLIYPVPDKSGLGIHSTLDLGGQIKFGPDTQYIDSIDYSIDSNLKEKFLTAIKNYFPKVDANKLQPAYAGIRPKLQGPDDSFRDFVLSDSNEHRVPRLINLFGIESPGLTSSLPIAKLVTEKLRTGS